MIYLKLFERKQQVVKTHQKTNEWFNLLDYYHNHDFDELKQFIENGIDINLTDANKNTALMLLTMNCINIDDNVIDYLLNNGADVNKINRHNMTALMYASNNGCIETVKLLLEKKPLLNIQDDDGETALFLATTECNVEVIHLLIEAGADITIKNRLGGNVIEYDTDLWEQLVEQVLIYQPHMANFLNKYIDIDDNIKKKYKHLFTAINAGLI